jgi:excisionase family DNA binding protein
MQDGSSVWYKTPSALRKLKDFSTPCEYERRPAELDTSDEYPWTVRQAAKFLGVSPQTVYLWVERQQIPHLRVMGRNIRFLKSDLERFRASFKQIPE